MHKHDLDSSSLPPLHGVLIQAENMEQMVKEEPKGAEFSGEEGLGRYLDLHEHHQRFVSAHKTFGRKLEYFDYVGCFAADLSATVPKLQKGSRQYREYLELLYKYLMTFYEKTQPLGQASKQLSKV